MFVSLLCVLSGEMAVELFGPFLYSVVYFLVIGLLSCFYSLGINYLSAASFAVILSHSKGTFSCYV